MLSHKERSTSDVSGTWWSASSVVTSKPQCLQRISPRATTLHTKTARIPKTVAIDIGANSILDRALLGEITQVDIPLFSKLREDRTEHASKRLRSRDNVRNYLREFHQLMLHRFNVDRIQLALITGSLGTLAFAFELGYLAEDSAVKYFACKRVCFLEKKNNLASRIR